MLISLFRLPKRLWHFNHLLLLAILHYFGLGTDVISLLTSYLLDRFQRVKISDILSAQIHLKNGVPDGSIFSRFRSAIYTAAFGVYLSFSNVHFYADYTQIFSWFSPAYLTLNSDFKSLTTI